ncbi:MAG: hypothetical protein ACK5H4_07030, partial [Lacrimispora sphenoides]
MIKYLVNRYRGWGIAKKTLIILLFVSIVPVMVIEIITCIIAANTIKKTDGYSGGKQYEIIPE